MRGPSSTAFSELLDIPGVTEALGLSYSSSNELNKIIDTQLPRRRPVFTHHEVVAGGESFDFFSRDIIECIRALYGDPNHTQYLSFQPERQYADADKTQRLYHDMQTGRWWWSTQKTLEEQKSGATVIPVILSSDKTQVTLFRNKTAYPVYLTIGNLPKTIRRKPSRQGQILLAYLPTSRLDHISNKTARRRTLANLFHACMGYIVEPLREAGVHGIPMTSGDGVTRRGHPILAAYIGDYPEQCLVTAAFGGTCPVCDCTHDTLGEYPCPSSPRDLDVVLDALDKLESSSFSQACRDANIRPVQHPFWESLPYVDIFRSITPDILHQLHQGVFKHLLQWLKAILGSAEIDARARRLPPNHSIRLFRKGITTLSRVSGTEHKQMSRFLLGLIIDAPLPRDEVTRLLQATRSLLDFIYLAQYPIHSDRTLEAMEDALGDFHTHKDIFIELGAREQLNIPKLHMLLHYARAIRDLGTADNFNTEATERLHIDLAKDAYAATNHKDELFQMVKWLERKEKVFHHASYIHWKEATSTPPAASSREQWVVPDLACVLHQKMTRHPTRPNVSLADIQSPKHYGARFFTAAVLRFVTHLRQPDITARDLEIKTSERSLPLERVSAFHRLKFVNAEAFGPDTFDSVHVQPSRYNPDGAVASPARFDTVLVRVDADTSAGIKQYRVAQVRLIFTLPDSVMRLLLPGFTEFPEHLAYVEWFSAFTSSPDRASGLYKVHRDVNGGQRQASVIPVSVIERSVHLIPKWGAVVPSRWTSDNVLEECTTFYVNVFKDTHTYFNVY
ncbi:hypothetical protein CONPUDRAFT_132383 [Coniophora puteana RWD-64-598 SS2]|uniref:Uncharacterized protein n=1 Tax=Coniophora puteana (strain RWD-64-598) TaxID=741705 RepID=A0A5M3M7I0_CONPW|nr:uncharacterized protein CONPUDRAFT_132383 [Coniophora puteana RWD-64-598 SS2]EIW74785.1 hypothetical protein CONPUDRAFT_132383 [Coniophora puteana RWD-64-598 SS2]